MRRLPTGLSFTLLKVKVPSLTLPFAQGVGGNFTHFYSGTLHAIDFECPEGTPVLAVAGGTVKEVRQSNTAGGVHARGLFEWNSVRGCGACLWFLLSDAGFPYVPHTSVVYLGGFVSKAKLHTDYFSCTHIAVDKFLLPLCAFPSTQTAKNVFYEFYR